jgi:hypothetical protein
MEQAQVEMWQKLKRELHVALIFAVVAAYFFFFQAVSRAEGDARSHEAAPSFRTVRS